MEIKLHTKSKEEVFSSRRYLLGFVQTHSSLHAVGLLIGRYRRESSHVVSWRVEAPFPAAASAVVARRAAAASGQGGRAAGQRAGVAEAVDV